jgi:hypothetical protein
MMISSLVLVVAFVKVNELIIFPSILSIPFAIKISATWTFAISRAFDSFFFSACKSDISDLQALKKKLSNALDIAKVQVAEIFIANGIDRIDGNIISSLTLTNATTKTKDEIIIKNEEALINLGYVKFSVDMDAVEKALQTKEGKKELKKLVDVIPVTVSTPAKIKVNTKRTSANNSEIESNETEEILVIEQQIEEQDYESKLAA